MRLYFTRHGESEANVRKIISNRGLPHPLTETGRLQAAALAEKLRERPITRIYASPIPRARETAEIVSAALGAPLELADGLREPDCGVLEGRSDEAAWVEHDRWKKNWSSGRDLDKKLEGGESYEDVRERFVAFVKGLVARYGKTDAEFLLVTHGAAMLIGLPALFTVDQQSILNYGLGHTALFAAEVQDGKLAWSRNIWS